MDQWSEHIENAREVYQDMTTSERQCLIALLTQTFVLSEPYYSKVIFQAEAPEARPGPFTYTINQGRNIRAFSYAFDSGQATTAGYPAGYTATRADTNTADAQKTNAGESVEIFGFALQPIPAFVRDLSGTGVGPYQTDRLSDGRFLGLVDDAVSVSLQLNAGREGYFFGNISMAPGAGGFEGAGNDRLGTEPLQGGRPKFSYMTNGRPETNNYFQMPEGMVWLPAGRRDSMLSVRFLFERPVVAYSGGDLDNNAILGRDIAPVAGIQGYLYPQQVGASLMVWLKGKIVSARTMIS